MDEKITQESCKQCKYCECLDEDWYECHRLSPRIVEAMVAPSDKEGRRYADMIENGFEAHAVWPTVHGHDWDWCGEFEARNISQVLPSWSNMAWGARVHGALRRNGISSVEQLLQQSRYDLLKIKDFGRTSLREVIRKLADHNLALRPEG